MKARIITARELTIGARVTDHDVLADLNERGGSVEVVKLERCTDRNGLAGIAVTLVGSATHTQVWGFNFDIEVAR